MPGVPGPDTPPGLCFTGSTCFTHARVQKHTAAESVCPTSTALPVCTWPFRKGEEALNPEEFLQEASGQNRETANPTISGSNDSWIPNIISNGVKKAQEPSLGLLCSL